MFNIENDPLLEKKVVRDCVDMKRATRDLGSTPHREFGVSEI
jgi:hypothetical protein